VFHQPERKASPDLPVPVSRRKDREPYGCERSSEPCSRTSTFPDLHRAHVQLGAGKFMVPPVDLAFGEYRRDEIPRTVLRPWANTGRVLAILRWPGAR
jgi:hypothetical protein